MMFKLALRNITRHFRRTFLGVLSIVLGVFLLIIFNGLLEGSNTSWIESLVKTNIGDIRIYQKDYYEEMDKYPLENLLENSPELNHDLKNLKGVVAVAPRLEFTAFLTDGESELPMIGVGIAPEQDEAVFEMSRYITRGHYLKPGEKGILISETTAEAFGADTGSFLTMMSRTKYDVISADDFEVKGIFRTYNPDVDEIEFFVDLSRIQEFLELDNEVSVPVLKLQNRALAPQIAIRVEEALSDKQIKARNWVDLTRDARQVLELKGKFSTVLGLLLLVIAGFGIMNTMLMAYFERRKEMGTLLAIGMNHRQLRRLFLLEGSMIGLLGMIIGVALGCALNYHFSIHGLAISDISNVQFALTEGKLFTEFSLAKALLYGFLGLFTALVSTWIPSRRIRFLEPAEVLRA